MKILHTADWHLGKKLDRFSRLEEQTEVLEEIIQIADSQNIDIVVIAGDLFDTFNPPTEAVDLFYKTLKRLSKNGKRPVVAISGNHDSPNFIDAPNPLARECGIILIGQPNAIMPLSELQDFSVTKSEEGFIEIQLKKEDFPIRIFHTAYANEVRLKTYFGENKEDELNTILKEKWKNISEKHADSNGVNLLMTHLYMNKKGAEILEAQKSLLFTHLHHCVIVLVKLDKPNLFPLLMRNPTKRLPMKKKHCNPGKNSKENLLKP